VAGQALASNTETRASQGGENDHHKNPTDTMASPGYGGITAELAIQARRSAKMQVTWAQSSAW
jgi:hypothetical protein